MTRLPPIHDEMAEAMAKPIVTMPANTGSRPSPLCRNSVVRMNVAGSAAKYVVEMSTPLRYEACAKTSNGMSGTRPRAA